MKGTRNLLATAGIAMILGALPGVVVRAAEAGGSSDSGGVLEFQVISREGKTPIAGVKLEIQADGQTRQNVTNGEGRCRIEYGPKLSYLGVRASKEGLVPLSAGWRARGTPLQVPAEYTLAMEPGTIIGGIIRDEDDKPIEGATVSLLVPSDGSSQIERVMISDHPEKTDAEGRWRCDIIPARLNEIAFRLSHPDYISDEMFGKTPAPPIQSLRNQTAVMVMRKGVTLTGRVVDMEGKPIEGATVAQGSDRFGTNYPSTGTDKDGRFEFKNVRPEPMVLTVQAKGFAPGLEQPLPRKGMAPIEFKLERGRTLRGRIVDKAGNPVAGAFVSADTWRGHRSLQWRVNTDAEGRFRWDEAPADEVLIDMGKRDYMSVRGHGMTASDQEYTITMLPILRIKGRVVDKETGQPIPQFTICPGIDWRDGRPVSWERRQMKPFTDGVYEITFSMPRPGHCFRAEAEGYLPGVSRSVEDGEGDVTHDLALVKSSGIGAVVRFPDGQPVVGAEVILCTPSVPLYIQNGRSQQRDVHVSAQTGPDGRFFFPPETDEYRLIVLHDKGFANVPGEELGKSADLTLRPWGRVEGRVLIGAKPGEGEEVRVHFEGPQEKSAPRILFNNGAVADKEGRFVMDHVPPGKARICRLVRVSDRNSLVSHDVPIEIKAGEAVEVTIGGTGRPVIGKVAIPENVKNLIDWQTPDYLVENRSDRGFCRSLGMKLERDGSFRIDDVPAGDYRIQFSAYAPATTPRSFRGERIGSLTHSFTVAEMPGGRSDEPLDLGVLDLLVLGGAATGPFLSGRPVPDLKDLRLGVAPEELNGKRLVLCFFDTNQRPSRNSVLQLTRQAETLRAKGIVPVVVAVQIPKDEETAFQEWARQNAAGLVVGIAPDEGNRMRSTWGVRSLPWLILTDARHVVQAEGFGVEELDSLIAGEKK